MKEHQDREIPRDIKRSIADRFLENAPAGVEQNPERLKHMLSTDIRDTLPPQIFALISAVAEEVRRNLEEK